MWREVATDGFRKDGFDSVDSLTGGWMSMDSLTRRESDAEASGPLNSPERGPELEPELERAEWRTFLRLRASTLCAFSTRLGEVSASAPEVLLVSGSTGIGDPDGVNDDRLELTAESPSVSMTVSSGWPLSTSSRIMPEAGSILLDSSGRMLDRTTVNSFRLNAGEYFGTVREFVFHGSELITGFRLPPSRLSLPSFFGFRSLRLPVRLNEATLLLVISGRSSRIWFPVVTGCARLVSGMINPRNLEIPLLDFRCAEVTWHNVCRLLDGVELVTSSRLRERSVPALPLHFKSRMTCGSGSDRILSTESRGSGSGSVVHFPDAKLSTE